MEAIADETKLVPLRSIFIAPENPRANLEADEGIPQLGRTLVACQVYPILVRPAKKGEASEFGALDGRRRFLGFQSAKDEGLITDEHLVAVTVITDKARQQAAVTLANHEREAGHITDVIMAIGRMKKAKLKSAAIAKALGYSETQIRRWSKLADLEPAVLAALRADDIDLEAAQLMTRLSPEAQVEFAERAQNEHSANITYYVKNAVMGGAVTSKDNRFGLITVDDYVAAGGRIESDLFGEQPDVILDPEILQRAWTERAQATVDALKGEGLTVFFGDTSYWPPEGFERYPHINLSALTQEQRARYDEAAAAQSALIDLSRDKATPADQRPTPLQLLLADLHTLRVLHSGSQPGAIVLRPSLESGLNGTIYAAPADAVEGDENQEDDDDQFAARTASPTTPPRAGIAVPEVRVDVEGVNHSLHERYTVVATRGLIKSVADDPNAAFVLLVARLFVSIAMPYSSSTSESISTIKAERFSNPKHAPIADLDGDVLARIETFTSSYSESGLRPIPWVASLAQGERMTLMTLLVAMSLDGKEFATHNIRKAARAEAGELVELTAHDISHHWVPDGEFFAAHSKKQLLPMLSLMSVDDPAAATLKKDELAGLVAQSADEVRWAPRALSWHEPEAELVEETDDQVENDNETEESVSESDTAPEVEISADDRKVAELDGLAA